MPNIPSCTPHTVDKVIRIECDTVCGVASCQQQQDPGEERDTWAVFYPDSKVLGVVMSA